MDIKKIYSEVREWVETYYGKKGWFYSDFFLDENGFELFQEEIETDGEITMDMTDDEVIYHIEESLGKCITMSMWQQEMLIG